MAHGRAGSRGGAPACCPDHWGDNQKARLHGLLLEPYATFPLSGTFLSGLQNSSPRAACWRELNLTKLFVFGS